MGKEVVIPGSKCCYCKFVTRTAGDQFYDPRIKLKDKKVKSLAAVDKFSSSEKKIFINEKKSLTKNAKLLYNTVCSNFGEQKMVLLI